MKPATPTRRKTTATTRVACWSWVRPVAESGPVVSVMMHPFREMRSLRAYPGCTRPTATNAEIATFPQYRGSGASAAVGHAVPGYGARARVGRDWSASRLNVLWPGPQWLNPLPVPSTGVGDLVQAPGSSRSVPLRASIAPTAYVGPTAEPE